MELAEWIEDNAIPDSQWFVKRLTGNDTLANGTHQAGPYIPKSVMFSVLPTLNTTAVKNPDVKFSLFIDSHADVRPVRGIYYNDKFHDNPKNGRNETRITGFGGASSPLLDPEATGSLAVFAFAPSQNGMECHVWITRHATEEDVIEDIVGQVEPGRWVLWRMEMGGQLHLFSKAPAIASCILTKETLPPDWLLKFPKAQAIVDKSMELRPEIGVAADRRLVRRRDCEFSVFKSIEEAWELPVVSKGFGSVEDFVARANSVLQRRKSRAGMSLELHLRRIFAEEGLTEGTDFDWNKVSENGKTPDFVFPSSADYRIPTYPASSLRMLAVKTSLKDRWRQVLNEADRIPYKHLFTLQEGLSANQYREIVDAGVQLVVPEPIISTFSEIIQPGLQTLESFIAEVRLLK